MDDLSPRERRRNARELERLMRELDELDRRHSLGASPAEARRAARAHRSAASESRRGWGVGLVVAMLLLGYVLLVPGGAGHQLRQLAGLDPTRSDTAPAQPTSGRGYGFSLTQPDSAEPVGWDPCQPIPLVLNLDGAPEGARRLVDTAIAHTSQASGLTFEVAGLTDDRRFFEPRTDFVGRQQPALVGWATPAEVEGLRGDVAGLGGAASLGLQGARQYYVTGGVVLDRALFGQLVRTDAGRQAAQAIVDHEFGHLVGLAHVDDPTQLMAPQSSSVTTYGAGDLRGLARLGNVPCR